MVSVYAPRAEKLPNDVALCSTAAVIVYSRNCAIKYGDVCFSKSMMMTCLIPNNLYLLSHFFFHRFSDFESDLFLCDDIEFKHKLKISVNDTTRILICYYTIRHIILA